MALSTTDGSKTLYTYMPEAVAGAQVTGAYKTLRSKVGVKFDVKRETFASQDRRADRMESSLSYGNKSGDFSIPIEWSYGTYDDLMAAVLGDVTAAGTATWGTNILKIGNAVKTYSFEETSDELDITEAALGCQFSSFSISQKLNGIAEGDFSGMFRSVKLAQTLATAPLTLAYAGTGPYTITRSVAGFMTIDGFANGDSVMGLGNADAGNNNTTPWTITSLTDTVMTFTVAAGFAVKAAASGMRLNLATKSSSVVAASTTTPFDSFTGSITEGGVVIAHVTGWDLKVEQAIQPNFALGSDSAQSISVGKIKVTGNISVYYIDQALRKKFINGLSSSLTLVLGSVAATKAYTIDLGTVKYTSNTRDDSELARTETMAFNATYDATNLSTIKITRTP